MTKLCGIDADYVNWRPVTGRKVLTLTFEVDISRQEEVLRYLGAPASDKSIPCAIALLDMKSACAPVADGKPDLKALSDSLAKRVLTEGVQPDGSYRQVSVANGIPKKWNDYARSQQAYILCRDPDFCRYFCAESGSETATIAKLRTHFKIGSRGDLDKPENHERWDEFVALFHLHRDRLK